MTKLGRVLGPSSGGQYQLTAIQRLNAVLLISRNRDLITRGRDCAARLDQAGTDGQNRRATDIAAVLQGTLVNRREADHTTKLEIRCKSV